jgi:hypothetical protein
LGGLIEFSADKGLAEHWRQVFQDHPEFFRLDQGRKKASLVWRRQFPKRYSVDTLNTISDEEYEQMDDQQKDRISRGPLSDSDIKTLIDTAINLHSRALEAQKHQQWYRPILLQAGAGLLGALIGVGLSSQLKPNDARPNNASAVQTPTQPATPSRK